MDQVNIARIDAAFDKLKSSAAKDVKSIYEKMEAQLKDLPAYSVAGAIATKEAGFLNNYIMEFTRSVKAVAMEQMAESGCRDYLTEGGWTEILKAAGMPSIQLCRVEQTLQNKTRPAAGGGTYENTGKGAPKLSQGKAEELTAVKKMQMGTAVAGAACIAVSLIVPGWGIVAVALCGAGTVMVVGGSAGAVYTESKLREADRRSHDRQTGASGGKGKDHSETEYTVGALVRKVTDSQRRCNTAVIHNWLDEVRKALIQETDKLMSL